MKNYIGVKIVKAEPMEKDGKTIRGRSGGISFAVPCTAYAGRTGRRCDVCKASGMLWEMHMVWGAYVPCLRMLCAASCCGKRTELSL